MMPLAPTPIVAVPSKPKIGFSIDSIVGGGREDRLNRLDRVEIERDGSPSEVEGSSSPTRSSRQLGGLRSPSGHSEGSDRPVSRGSSVESYPGNNSRHTPSSRNGNRGLLSLSSRHSEFNRTTSHSDGSTPNESPSPPHGLSRDSPVTGSGNRHHHHHHHHHQSHPPPPPPPPPSQQQAGPQLPPGVVRPSPNYLAPPPGATAAAAVAAAEQLKSLYGLPGGHPSGGGSQSGQNEYHSQQLALAANLAAAQHFQAANLAVALQAHHGGSPHGPPHGAYPHPGGPGGPHPPTHPHQPPRDSYPLYPWLLSRHGRIFPHRFPGGPDIPGFLLQPFRKPKRIRTAFSPSQLLKLEHAFEKNHYVVGAERKQLAQALSLTETQVKVWFQNRRTKHKRMQQEEEAKAQQQSGGNGNNNGANKNTHHVSKWQQETGDYHGDEEEHVDPEADECSSGSEA